MSFLRPHVNQTSICLHDDSRFTHWHRSIADTVADVVAAAAAAAVAVAVGVAVAVDVAVEYDAVVVIMVFVVFRSFQIQFRRGGTTILAQTFSIPTKSSPVPSLDK